MKTTNYYNTLILIADDCPAVSGEVPPEKENKITIANQQFEMIRQHPYHYTSDDIIFGIYAAKNDILETELEKARKDFFAKGQACLRSSPLSKRYGWGIHHNADGKIAILGSETEAYENLIKDDSVTKVKAMRNKRA